MSHRLYLWLIARRWRLRSVERLARYALERSWRRHNAAPVVSSDLRREASGVGNGPGTGAAFANSPAIRRKAGADG